MKKPINKTSKSDDAFSVNLTETITAVQKSLAEAISFDVIRQEEITAIKSSLSELGSGKLFVSPFGAIGRFVESLIPELGLSKEEPVARPRAYQTEASSVQKETIVGHEIEGQVEDVELFHAELEPSRVSFSMGPADEIFWSIVMPDSFTKSIRGLDKKLKGRILDALGKITQDPLKENGDTVKALSSDKKGLWRYRIGDYRLIYRPEVEANRIVLLVCGSRGSVYE